MDLEFLEKLDRDRRSRGELDPRFGLVREFSAHRSECTIVFSSCPENALDEAIGHETSLAERLGHSLEWKVYGHDSPSSLGDRLRVFGFEPGPVESLLMLPVAHDRFAAFDPLPGCEIRRVYDRAGLDDVAAISREIGRRNVERETDRLSLILQNTPDEMSVFVASLEGKPVACGRSHFKPGSPFVEFCGGRTLTSHRRRGFYTALIAARLREAIARDRQYALVDALPTSEPILRKRGFEQVTTTQPWVYTSA